MACNQHLFSSFARALFDVPFGSAIPAQERTWKNAQMLNQCIVSWKQSHPEQDASLPPLLNELQSPPATVGSSTSAAATTGGGEGWIEQTLKSTSAFPSPSQQQISKTFQDMGYVHLLEDFRTLDGLSASIRLTNNIVVEVEDPKTTRLADGKTARGMITFKKRLLVSSGFWVASISTSEWPQNSSDEALEAAAREQFLKQTLNNLS
jgi:hypothetical protein